jgi:hypothetical protein
MREGLTRADRQYLAMRPVDCLNGVSHSYR